MAHEHESHSREPEDKTDKPAEPKPFKPGPMFHRMYGKKEVKDQAEHDVSLREGWTDEDPSKKKEEKKEEPKR